MTEMDFVKTFFEQYSLVEIFVFVIAILAGTKILSNLFEWFYNKMNVYFFKKTEEEKEINGLKEEYVNIINELKEIDKKLFFLKDQTKILTDRLQENSKSYIIDKHHYFCYQIKAIDDFSLQSLELRYMYYKSSGGDSYIDGLMQEIRELPKIDIKSIEMIMSKEGERSNGLSGT